jgi:hypothetical protein
VTFWSLVQLLIDIVLLAACGFLWVKLHRPQKDDPRLSRGLQLLGSKISVLEDLSDRTETQVKQLTTLMEQKVREIQKTLQEAELQIQKIDQSMIKSLEVAKIFQDKIPHQEIIERQNTIKYVKAARMAHRGSSVDDIASVVDLPRGEIEFIAKVNREQLQFSEQELPPWARETDSVSHPQEVKSAERSFSSPLKTQKVETPATVTIESPPQQTLKGLGEKFRQAMSQPVVPQTLVENILPSEARSSEARSSGGIKKVVFPRIDY